MVKIIYVYKRNKYLQNKKQMTNVFGSVFGIHIVIIINFYEINYKNKTKIKNPGIVYLFKK